MIPDELPTNLSEFAKHFYSEDEVDAAVDQFLLERNLEISEFAEMTEGEFLELFERSPFALREFSVELNFGRIISGLLTRLISVGIQFAQIQSRYFFCELRSSNRYNPVVHRVLVMKNMTISSLCNRSGEKMKKWVILTFGNLSAKQLCSKCASYTFW